MFAVTAAFKLFNDSSVIRAIGAQLALINSIGSTIAEGLGRLHDRQLPVTRNLAKRRGVVKDSSQSGKKLKSLGLRPRDSKDE